jgi:hypothetical protein
LDNSDEQAAAIRRELDARQEKINEMERVRAIGKSRNLFITTICKLTVMTVKSSLCNVGKIAFLLLLYILLEINAFPWL